jgi:DNA polymerase III epsilon subunit-like protein
VLDTETTGFVPRTHRVIELAWVLVEDGQITKEWTSLLGHDAPFIPPMVEVLTRIKTLDLQGKPTFAEVRAELEAVLTPDTLIVGQNIPFDLSMLKGEGLDLSHHAWLDTSMLASLAFPESRSFSLSYLSRTLGLPHAPVHRALGDVHATVALLERCFDRLCELPADLLTSAQALMQRGPAGWQQLAALIPPAKNGPRPSWLHFDRLSTTEGKNSALDLTPPPVGHVRLLELLPSESEVSSALHTPLCPGETKRLVAVKNLDATLRRQALPSGVAALEPPQFLLDPTAAEALLTQDTLNADELTLAMKLQWYAPRARRDVPLHGEERPVWNGRLACTEHHALYQEQINTAPPVVVLDHQQLLQLIQATDSPLMAAGTHVVITDASMLEDTATKAFGIELKLDDLRAASLQSAPLTSLSDLLAIWIGSLGGEDIRYLTTPDLQSLGAGNLRKLTADLIADSAHPAKTRELLLELQDVLREDSLDGRIVWVERRRGESLVLHVAPESPATLLKNALYDRFPTTLLVPPGASGDEAAIVPRGQASTRTPHAGQSVRPRLLLPSTDLRQLLQDPPTGKSIVLLGSKRAIEDVYVKYTEALEARDITLICQGTSGGQGRMEAEFLANEGTTLMLLTPWMYEGNELPAESVDRLIIESLPFDHPSHPVLSRRAEHYGSAFDQYLLPRTEQRLFRLLRTFCQQRRNLGDVQVLDQRLRTKAYGKRLMQYLQRLATFDDGELQPITPAPAASRLAPTAKPKPAKGNAQLPLL